MSVDVKTRTDEDIKVDITKQLNWDARIDASDISITVDGGRASFSNPARFFYLIIKREMIGQC
jgi:hypothetical protein